MAARRKIFSSCSGMYFWLPDFTCINIPHIAIQVNMMKKTRNFSPEFRLEAAHLVNDQGDTIKSVCSAMGIGKSTIEYSVR